jgi:hypothetical protein
MVNRPLAIAETSNVCTAFKRKQPTPKLHSCEHRKLANPLDPHLEDRKQSQRMAGQAVSRNLCVQRLLQSLASVSVSA